MMKSSAKVEIGFIGGGSMAGALIAILIKKKIFAPQAIGVSDLDRRRLSELRRKFKIVPFPDNQILTRKAPIVILAVKPQQMKEVLKGIHVLVGKRPLLISIAAGLDIAFYKKALSSQIRIIRVMPNAPAMIGEGASALYAGPGVSEADKEVALKIFSAAGRALFVSEEEWLDVVTAVSGSGPAFVYAFIEALAKAAIKWKLPESVALPLVLQTLVGAAKMVEKSTEPLAALIEEVASKGGTTEAGLRVMTEQGFAPLMEAVVDAAVKRGRELRKKL